MKKTMFVAIAVLAIILGIVAYATAATTVGPTSVNVSAAVNPKLDMTLNTMTYDFGAAVDPDAATLNSAANAIIVTVASNKAYDLTHAWTTNPTTPASPSGVFADNFTDVAKASTAKTAGTSYDVALSFNPDYELTPGAVNGVVQFTAAQ